MTCNLLDYRTYQQHPENMTNLSQKKVRKMRQYQNYMLKLNQKYGMTTNIGSSANI